MPPFTNVLPLFLLLGSSTIASPITMREETGCTIAGAHISDPCLTLTQYRERDTGCPLNLKCSAFAAMLQNCCDQATVREGSGGSVGSKGSLQAGGATAVDLHTAGDSTAYLEGGAGLATSVVGAADNGGHSADGLNAGDRASATIGATTDGRFTNGLFNTGGGSIGATGSTGRITSGLAASDIGAGGGISSGSVSVGNDGHVTSGAPGSGGDNGSGPMGSQRFPGGAPKPDTSAGGQMGITTGGSGSTGNGGRPAGGPLSAGGGTSGASGGISSGSQPAGGAEGGSPKVDIITGVNTASTSISTGNDGRPADRPLDNVGGVGVISGSPANDGHSTGGPNTGGGAGGVTGGAGGSPVPDTNITGGTVTAGVSIGSDGHSAGATGGGAASNSGLSAGGLDAAGISAGGVTCLAAAVGGSTGDDGHSAGGLHAGGSSTGGETSVAGGGVVVNDVLSTGSRLQSAAAFGSSLGGSVGAMAYTGLSASDLLASDINAGDPAHLSDGLGISGDSGSWGSGGLGLQSGDLIQNGNVGLALGADAGLHLGTFI